MENKQQEAENTREVMLSDKVMREREREKEREGDVYIYICIYLCVCVFIHIYIWETSSRRPRTQER